MNYLNPGCGKYKTDLKLGGKDKVMPFDSY